MKDKVESKDEKPKRKWHQAVAVMVKEVTLLRDTKDETKLKAIKFYSVDDREILYYPKKEQTVTSIINDFKTEVDKKEMFLISEYLPTNEMLLALNKACNKKPQELVMTYQEREFKEELYYNMFKNQFETIYFKGYHKTDENLQQQLANKTKHELNIEMPMDKK